MIKVFPLFASVAIVAFNSGTALGATLTGSELRLRAEAQATSSSQLFITSFPASAIVSESAVEFPNVASLFDPSTGVPPGFARSLVDVAINAGADYLEIDFDNARSSRYATGFKNTYVFTFTAPVALQITNVLIDPSTTLGLTPDRVTFNGSELFINVQGLFFTPSTFARVNLSTIAASDPNVDIIPDPDVDVPGSDSAAVPEPSSALLLGSAALVGTIFKRYTHLREIKR
jgi:hypothetical protein